jgi:hypothetical protein
MPLMENDIGLSDLKPEVTNYEAKSFSVSKVALKANTATAIVTFLDGYPKVKVSLTKEGGLWKIDKVKDARGDGVVK